MNERDFWIVSHIRANFDEYSDMSDEQLLSKLKQSGKYDEFNSALEWWQNSTSLPAEVKMSDSFQQKLNSTAQVFDNFRMPKTVKDGGDIIEWNFDLSNPPTKSKEQPPRQPAPQKMPAIEPKLSPPKQKLSKNTWENKLVLGNGTGGKYVPAGTFMRNKKLTPEQMLKMFPSLSQPVDPEQERMKGRLMSKRISR